MGSRCSGCESPFRITSLMTKQAASAEARLKIEGECAHILLEGFWDMQHPQPDPTSIVRELEKNASLRTVRFEDMGIEGWDSTLAAFVQKLARHCEARGLERDYSPLPDGLERLLNLAASSPVVERREQERYNPLARLGLQVLKCGDEFIAWLDFVGELTLSLIALVRGRAIVRMRDFLLLLQACGASALPIVALISFLVGLILAFVGAVQLAPFGADIYVANLVGVAMVREMGAMMCAMVMAGRTGAAYAAQIGSMKVTEEVDALKTLGISPMEFLVLPRALALVLMMPILCVFADFIGILGGMTVSLLMLEVTPVQYILQTDEAIGSMSFLIGVFKAGVFGLIIASAGCMRGLQCGSSSSAVGDASTSAVVTSITLVIIADAIFAVLLNILGL